MTCISELTKLAVSRRHCLLNGLDDIALTLQQADKITAYEKARGMQPV